MKSSAENDPAGDPVSLLQRLIRFNTTNPPGNERECLGYIRNLLTAAGIESAVVAKSTDRPNLVARLPGGGQAPPLLLYGHLDVVTTEKQPWKYPPFEGIMADGCVWGRGALDMKSGIAMFLSAVLRAKAEGREPPCDIILALLSDEEAGGEYGAGFLVQNHAGLLQDVRYALGEFGGFSYYLGGRRLYLIQVAEKQICWLRLKIKGTGGHASMPIRGQAMGRLSRIIQRLDQRRLPVHVTPAAREMITGMSSAIGGSKGFLLKQILRPFLTNWIIDLLGRDGDIFDPLLHNTACPTILQAGTKINVIPTEAAVEVDARLLPGFTKDDLLGELRRNFGPDWEAVEVEIIRCPETAPSRPDLGLFPFLADILREEDPEGVPVPYLLSGATDAGHFLKLGIQSYGFLPMKLPPEFNFVNTIHSGNERIPVDALRFGAEAVFKTIMRYNGTAGASGKTRR